MESILLSVTPIQTYCADTLLTTATGFFFQREGKLYLVTSRHVFCDEEAGHRPDRFLVTFHTDHGNATQSIQQSVPLYENRISRWVAGTDSAGNVDVAAIELDTQALPSGVVYAPFTPDNLLAREETIEVGTPLLIVGFPLGFHDTFHNLPVVRHAICASSFEMRFQGNGYFLTDARTHRGLSGAPVVSKDSSPADRRLPWLLLGVHSARFDVSNRDVNIDEALGLNCAWFADILLVLTDPKRVA